MDARWAIGSKLGTTQSEQGRPINSQPRGAVPQTLTTNAVRTLFNPQAAISQPDKKQRQPPVKTGQAKKFLGEPQQKSGAPWRKHTNPGGAGPPPGGTPGGAEQPPHRMLQGATKRQLYAALTNPPGL